MHNLIFLVKVVY